MLGRLHGLSDSVFASVMRLAGTVAIAASTQPYPSWFATVLLGFIQPLLTRWMFKS
ncbi:hypothetical protein [Deinococcus psychrotolerans]|uniref:hypothetical protein n=1 Tax=Deinococcus psychrotolerans TaxID=2489213 RepID=UPI0013DD9D07|nr:hypothetical protein [Deinococcus psychrotolerans]